MEHPLPGSRRVEPATTLAPETAPPHSDPAWSPPTPVRPEREPGVTLGFLAIGAALIWGVGQVGFFDAPSWTLRAATTLVVIAIGLPLLWGLRRSEHRLPALVAGALLIVALGSAAASTDPIRSIVGAWGWSIGWIALVGFVSAWALGVALTTQWVKRLEVAFLVVAVVNALVAIAQNIFRPPGMDVVAERASALAGNPVYLGGLLAAGAAVAVARSGSWRIAGLAGLLSFAAMTTTSRAAVIALAVVVAYALWKHRWVRGAVIAAVMVLAMAGGVLFTDAMDRSAEGASATERLSTTWGISARIDLWLLSVDAIEDRPFTGWGPGMFRDAVIPRRPLDQVAAQLTDVAWVDAHNVVVEFAVTTGIMGLVLLAAWLALSARRARGPLAFAALIILGIHLLQPMSMILTTLAMLALGASMTRTGFSTPKRTTWALAIPAVLAASVLLVGAVQLDRGRVDFDVDAAEQAALLLPMYSDPAVAASRAHALLAIETRDPGEVDAAIEWRREAIDRDSTNAFLWQGLGETYVSNQMWAHAEASFRQALVHDPWLRGAHIGLVRVAIGTSQPAAATPHLDVIDALGFDDVADDLRLQLESAAG